MIQFPIYVSHFLREKKLASLLFSEPLGCPTYHGLQKVKEEKVVRLRGNGKEANEDNTETEAIEEGEEAIQKDVQNGFLQEEICEQKSSQ